MTSRFVNGELLVNDQPYRILSGEMHYFRIPRAYWRDRLLKLRACGLNTVATYMPWNLHERQRGQFNFSGILDIRHFIELADELGLNMILRPGPYICSEWDFGGFPAWLLKDHDMRLRCSDQHYLDAVKSYFEAVFCQVRDFYDKNIIIMQIENGYASYGNDQVYYDFLKKLVDDSGFAGIVIAADGDSDTRIAAKVPDGVWQTLMCGREDCIPQLELMRKKQPDKPQMIVEYWNGQSMKTGQPLFMRDPDLIAENLDRALAWGAHINLYMFHGGTNFGFMNGAMRAPNGNYVQLLSSYDACAPLSECGDPTSLYHKLRAVISRYNPTFDESTTPVPAKLPKKAYGEVALTAVAGIADALDALASNTVQSPTTLSMEDIGGDGGFVRYTTELLPQSFPLPITLYQYQDRGWAFFNGKKIASFGRSGASFVVNAPDGGRLDIVIENMGRTNFFCNIEDNRKGISGGVILNNQQFQHGWTISTMPMEDLSRVEYRPLAQDESVQTPAFFRGTFLIDGDPCDSFLQIPNGICGFCRINGTTLGRYDRNGPAYTLFVPASWLHQGENVLEVCECGVMYKPTAKFLDRPLFSAHFE